MTIEGWDCHIHVFDRRRVEGHYESPPRSLSEIERLASPIGVSRFVLVQPSVYGTDNRFLIESLRVSGSRHRGIVVVSGDIDRAELMTMHQVGVRGIRINLVSPVGNTDRGLAALIPQIREMGWHIQWHVRPSQLTRIAEIHDKFPVTAVLDHLAGVVPSLASAEQTWEDLRRLAGLGAWIKLSGWYRLNSVSPFEDMHDNIRAAHSLFADRCIWGSDWPHTFFLDTAVAHAPPSYAETWATVVKALGEEKAISILSSNPRRLYQ
jgi:predicted TIM-barrel fold metal-dependent hydrolase